MDSHKHLPNAITPIVFAVMLTVLNSELSVLALLFTVPNSGLSVTRFSVIVQNGCLSVLTVNLKDSQSLKTHQARP